MPTWKASKILDSNDSFVEFFKAMYDAKLCNDETKEHICQSYLPNIGNLISIGLFEGSVFFHVYLRNCPSGIIDITEQPNIIFIKNTVGDVVPINGKYLRVWDGGEWVKKGNWQPRIEQIVNSLITRLAKRHIEIEEERVAFEKKQQAEIDEYHRWVETVNNNWK